MSRKATLVFLFATATYGQSFTGEVFASIGHGRLFRFDDNPIGGGPNVAGGIGLRHRSGLGIELELNRTLGLSAKAAPCGIVDFPCEGSAREGVTGATLVSGNVSYEFTRARVRPYVIGGVGALRSKGYSSMLRVTDERAVFREDSWSDTGLAISFGGGFRIFLTRSLSLRPELRVYSASTLSRANLSLFRPSVTVAWHW